MLNLTHNALKMYVYLQGNSSGSPRMGLLAAKQASQQAQQQKQQQAAAQSMLGANGHTSAPAKQQGLPADMLQALLRQARQNVEASLSEGQPSQPHSAASTVGSASQNSQRQVTSWRSMEAQAGSQQKSGSIAGSVVAAVSGSLGHSGQQAGHNGHSRAAGVPEPSVEWTKPPEVDVPFEADTVPGRGESSLERKAQRMRQRAQVCGCPPKLEQSSCTSAACLPILHGSAKLGNCTTVLMAYTAEASSLLSLGGPLSLVSSACVQVTFFWTASRQCCGRFAFGLPGRLR